MHYLTPVVLYRIEQLDNSRKEERERERERDVYGSYRGKRCTIKMKSVNCCLVIVMGGGKFHAKESLWYVLPTQTAIPSFRQLVV